MREADRLEVFKGKAEACSRILAHVHVKKNGICALAIGEGNVFPGGIGYTFRGLPWSNPPRF